MAKNNYKLNFLLICDLAFINKENEKLNLVGIFDKLTTTEFPTTSPGFSIVAQVEETGNSDHMNHSASIKLKYKNNEIGSSTIDSFTYQEKINLIFNFSLWKFEEPGEYTAVLKIDDIEVATLVIPVTRE